MNVWLIAFVNGFVLSIPLALAVWFALRLTRGALNSATRYGVWWMTLLVAAGLPGFFLPARPRPIPAPVHVMRAPAAEEPPVEASRATSIVKVAAAPVNTAWLPRTLVAVWSIAALLTVCRLAVSLFILRLRKKRSSDAPTSLVGLIDTCLARCKVRRRVRMAVTAEGASPLVAGPFGSCILIPARLLSSLNDAELEQICLHEAAHLARFDDWALLPQRLIEALFALHPVVRWIGRHIDLEREIACDDFVLELTGEPKSYASCLTRVAELAQGYSGSPVAAAAANESAHLDSRIEMLLNRTRRAGTRILKARFAAALTVLALLTWLGGRAPALLAIASPPPPIVQTVQTARPRPPLVPLLQAAAQPPVPLPPVRAQSLGVAVTVTDPRHRFVTGLDSSAFRIFEDGVEQKVASVEGPNDGSSLSIVSDEDARPVFLDDAIADARKQLETLRRVYKDEYPDVVTLKEKLQRLTDERRSLPAASRQGLLEKTRAAIESAKASKTGAIVIAFDARDKSLFWPENELHALIRDATVPIYSIAVQDPGTDSTTFLDLLTNATGGRRFMVAEWTEVPDVERKIDIETRNQYTVTWNSKSAPGTGGWHRIEVRMATPAGLPELTAHTIPGYYADK
jgi:beta-lactamase regulating signal transducer with metallopeptidase domain